MPAAVERRRRPPRSYPRRRRPARRPAAGLPRQRRRPARRRPASAAAAGAAERRLGVGGLLVGALVEVALPLGQRLAGGDGARLGLLVGVAAATAGAQDQTVGDGGGDDPGQQLGRADRVVVARDREVDLVRVAVGVQHRDDRDAQLAGLVDGDVLLLGVDHPDRRRDLRHVPQTTEGLGELDLLAVQLKGLLLGVAGGGAGQVTERLQLLHPLQPLVHRLEVGEHAAQPAVVDVRLADPGRLLGDRLLRLLLGADEEDVATLGDGVAHVRVRLLDVLEGLAQVDDVDTVALGEDEALHLRVPAAGLVPEVDTALQQLTHGHDGHGGLLPVYSLVVTPTGRWASWRPVVGPGWARQRSGPGRPPLTAMLGAADQRSCTCRGRARSTAQGGRR